MSDYLLMVDEAESRNLSGHTLMKTQVHDLQVDQSRRLTDSEADLWYREDEEKVGVYVTASEDTDEEVLEET